MFDLPYFKLSKIYTLISGKNITCISSLKNSNLIFKFFTKLARFTCLNLFVLATSLLNRDFLKLPSRWYFPLLSQTKGKNNLFRSWIFWMLLLKFSIYLSGAASSLTFCSFCSFNLMYLLRKYKITSIKNTNAVMQPIALPTKIFMLFHLSLISLSSISILIGVESKLNRFLLFIFKKGKINFHESKPKF